MYIYSSWCMVVDISTLFISMHKNISALTRTLPTRAHDSCRYKIMCAHVSFSMPGMTIISVHTTLVQLCNTITSVVAETILQQQNISAVFGTLIVVSSPLHPLRCCRYEKNENFHLSRIVRRCTVISINCFYGEINTKYLGEEENK